MICKYPGKFDQLMGSQHCHFKIYISRGQTYKKIKKTPAHIHLNLIEQFIWFTVMKYLCHKWSRICSTCRKHFPHSWLITGFVTRLTRRVPLVEQELLTIPEHLSSPPIFSGIRVTRSLVLYVCFVDRCLSFCTFFFWPLCCLFIFDMQILITHLVSSNSSYIFIYANIVSMRSQQEC